MGKIVKTADKMEIDEMGLNEMGIDGMKKSLMTWKS